MAAFAGGAGGGDEDWWILWERGNPNRKPAPISAGKGLELKCNSNIDGKPLPPGTDPRESKKYEYPKTSTGNNQLDKEVHNLVDVFNGITNMRVDIIHRLMQNGNKKIPKPISDDIRLVLNMGVNAQNLHTDLERRNANPPDFNPVFLQEPKRPVLKKPGTKK